jgi:hypothetical protein
MSFDLKINSGDFSLENGDLKLATDNDKLIQDILKICITPAGGNPFHQWYGSLISKTLIGSSLDSGIVLELSRTQLENAIQNLKSLQEKQAKQFQNLSPFEQINYIMDISVDRSGSDFRLFKVRVKVLSKGLKPLTTDFNISTI